MENTKTNSPHMHIHPGSLEHRHVHTCFHMYRSGEWRKAIHGHCLFGSALQLTSKEAHTSYLGPQTSHWIRSLYSDPGTGTEPWNFEHKHRYFCCFEHLANTRTNPVKDTYSFLKYLLLKHFPICSLDLSHKTPKPANTETCGTAMGLSRTSTWGNGRTQGSLI